MTAPLPLSLPRDYENITTREILAAVRTGENGGPVAGGTPGIKPVVVAVPVKNGDESDVFYAMPSGVTDPDWPVIRYDSRGNNQIRIVPTIKQAGAASAVVYCEYWNGSAWVTPGVTPVVCSLATAGAFPAEDQGWVTLVTGAIGDKLWRHMLRDGNGVASPAIQQSHNQFRQKTAAAPPIVTPPGDWGNIVWDINAASLGALYSNGDEVPLWPDDSPTGADMTTAGGAVINAPEYQATGFPGGLPCVSTSGNNLKLSGTNPTAPYGDWTYYFVVSNLDGGGDAAYILDGSSGYPFGFALYADSSVVGGQVNSTIFGPTDDSASVPGGMANPHIYRLVKSSTMNHWWLFCDGALIAESGCNPQANSTTTISILDYVAGIGMTAKMGRGLAYDTYHIAPTGAGGATVADGLTGPEITLKAFWGTP